MPGVSIVSDVVIGANAVVVSDLDSPGVYVGQPAKIIRQLKEVD
jgi:acetyltransferase-like isoleucine patch superfamily enzyme